MKNFLLLLLLLLSPLAFGSSAVNPANTGNIGGYQGTSTAKDSGYSLTFSASFGTTANLSYSWWISGDRMHLSGSFQTTGATGSPAEFILDPAFPMDLTKVGTRAGITGRSHSLFSATQFATSGGWEQVPFSDGSTSNKIFWSYKGDGGTSFAKSNGNDWVNSTGYISFDFDYPLARPAGGAGASSPLIYYGEFNGTGSNYWTTAASSPTIPAPNGTPSLANKTTVNVGTVTIPTIGSIAPGFTFTAPVSCSNARIEICLFLQTATSALSNVELYENGSSTVVGVKSVYRTSNQYENVCPSGYMNIVAGTTYTFVARLDTSTGTMFVGGLGAQTRTNGNARLECR